jgi:molybdopterin-guanine dinucleotide biosynthesis protein A
MADDAPILGAILAGGQSRRMGGVEKSLLDLAGRPMIAHVAQRLSPQVAATVICANGDPSRFEFLGLAVVPDPAGLVSGPHSGPLAGLLAAIRWARTNAPACSAIATAAADTPFLPLDLVPRLAQASPSAATVALARSAGRVHPVFGLWPVALEEDLSAFLAAGEGKVMAFASRIGCVAVEFKAEPDDPFFNVNTGEDLDHARKRASRLL